jgi:hypothetical protein
LPLRARLAAAIAACAIAILVAPQAAMANAWTGGAKGPLPGLTGVAGAPWYTWGTRQTIETRIPGYALNGSGAYVAETRHGGYGDMSIVQVGYACLGGLYNEPKYFYQLTNSSTGYFVLHYLDYMEPTVGQSYRYQIAKDFSRNWWVGKVGTLEIVHTGVENVSWTPNAIEDFGEIQLSSYDYFVGTTANHTSFTSQEWMGSNSVWHGGALFQWHSSDEGVTITGRNDIVSPSGQGSWTIWDSAY